MFACDRYTITGRCTLKYNRLNPCSQARGLCFQDVYKSWYIPSLIEVAYRLVGGPMKLSHGGFTFAADVSIIQCGFNDGVHE